MRFSARTVAALDALGASYAAVDILPDPRIRQELSAISNWPTIPQLFVNGELVGGCDIVTEMYESRELAQTLGIDPAVRGPEDARPRAGRPAPPDQEQPRLIRRSSSLRRRGAGLAASGDGRRRRAGPSRRFSARRWRPRPSPPARPGTVAFALMTEDGRISGRNCDRRSARPA